MDGNNIGAREFSAVIAGEWVVWRFPRMTRQALGLMLRAFAFGDGTEAGLLLAVREAETLSGCKAELIGYGQVGSCDDVPITLEQRLGS